MALIATARLLCRAVWRRLPRTMRQGALDRVSRWLLPRARRRSAGPPTSIVVVGLFRTASGIGESARLCYRALVRRGHPVTACDLSVLFDQDDLDPGIPTVRAITDPNALIILHVNAPETVKALWAIGRRCHPGWRVVGYWAWELPVFPVHWERAFSFLDEIWTPSTFCLTHLSHADAPPIRVIPHPVADGSRPRQPGRRASHGLPEDAFVCLTFADARSSLTRKNPAAAVQAFLAAFGDRSDTILVVKVRNLSGFPAEAAAFIDLVSRHPNLVFLDKTLDDSGLSDLLACCDVLISLHRSEGFGLCLAEAMALGKPVVASGWSGNLDFMTAETGMLVPVSLVPVADPSGQYAAAGASWADPDVSAAATALRRLERDRAFARDLGTAAQRSVAQRLTADAYETAIGFGRAMGGTPGGGTRDEHRAKGKR